VLVAGQWVKVQGIQLYHSELFSAKSMRAIASVVVRIKESIGWKIKQTVILPWQTMRIGIDKRTLHDLIERQGVTY
jgi:hypothetical protein